MFSLRQPDADAIERFLETQASLAPTYPAVGATAAWGDPEWRPPAGYHLDRACLSLGSGRTTYQAAVEALRQWKPFDVGWVAVSPARLPLEPGRVVAVRARILGLWTLHACRIVYTIDDEGPTARFGFGYGTLPGHAETGEERFLVEWNRTTGDVSYDVAAFVRPRHPLARIAGPYAKRVADRFRRDSAVAMRRAVQAAT